MKKQTRKSVCKNNEIHFALPMSFVRLQEILTPSLEMNILHFPMYIAFFGVINTIFIQMDRQDPIC